MQCTLMAQPMSSADRSSPVEVGAGAHLIHLGALGGRFEHQGRPHVTPHDAAQPPPRPSQPPRSPAPSPRPPPRPRPGTACPPSASSRPSWPPATSPASTSSTATRADRQHVAAARLLRRDGRLLRGRRLSRSSTEALSTASTAWTTSGRRPRREPHLLRVQQSFATQKANIVNAMANGAYQWEAASSGVNFTYVPSAAAPPDAVLFSVEPTYTTQYIARAFFPSSSTQRNVLVNASSLFISDEALTSTLRWLSEELGKNAGRCTGRVGRSARRKTAPRCWWCGSWLSAQGTSGEVHRRTRRPPPRGRRPLAIAQVDDVGLLGAEVVGHRSR